ncbi:hypothetical protein [Lentilactobacillus buchneri]|uniref:hypothetical protein n=1 Tax=Lentilactobacillus buchneri TaxID=1581 RepID=UPI0011EBF4B4|nr:hypothetical protein [Lentilactobacillus buchneri]
MSKYNDTILTNAGVDLASRAAHGDASFKIVRVESTADDLSGKTEDELKAMTTIPNKVQDGSIVGQEDTAPAIQGIQLQFLNTGLTKPYSIQAMGIYAKEDGKEQEILYAITTAEKEHPQYMPDFADKVTLRFGMTIRVVVGDKANVVIVFDPDGLATIKFVQDAIANVKLPDMSSWQKQKLTNDDGSPKLAISATQDVNAVIGQAIGKVGAGVISIDISALNNQAGHSLLGTYQVTTTVLNAVLQASDGTLWSFISTKAGSGATFVWKQVATADDLKSMNLNVLHRDPNTGKATDAIDFDPGKLTIGGHPALSIVMCTDEADAKAKSAANPNPIYVYPKES